MAAFTSIIAGISALSGVAGVVNAKNAQAAQKKRMQKQETEAKNIASLEAQAQGKEADVVLGTAGAGSELLPIGEILKKAEGRGKATRPGGLSTKKATNIGGL